LSLSGADIFHCRKGKISAMRALGLMPKEGLFQPDYCSDPSSYEDISSCTREHVNIEKLEASFAREC